MDAQQFAAGLERRLPRTVGFFQNWLRRFFEIEGVERSIALASLAFTALFPLLIVYASVAPHTSGERFVDGLIDRFDLTGAAAASLTQAFAPPEEVEGGVTFASLLFVLVSALSFTRAFQRVYERSWQLDKLGLRGTKFGLFWLGAMIIAYTLRPITGLRTGHPLVDGAITIALSAAIWLITPYLLLSKRLPWQRLLPSALITAVFMTCVGVGSLVYVPASVESSAEQFGVIGVAFALLGWLVASGFAITIAATGGAVFTETVEQHSSGKLAAYLALHRVQPAGSEGGEEDGAEGAAHRGERRPREQEQHQE